MDKLVLYPSDTSQWYALVNEAQVLSHHQLHEDLESYLVFLLIRFIDQPRIVSKILAIDFLDSLQASGQSRTEKLRNVGDRSLLFAGLFPELAVKRRVSADYFTRIGRSAYATLSTVGRDNAADLFAALCREFVSLAEVLQAVRQLPHECDELIEQSNIEKLIDVSIDPDNNNFS